MFSRVAHMSSSADQCDQMAKFCLQYLAVSKKENLPNVTKICQKSFEILPNTI